MYNQNAGQTGNSCLVEPKRTSEINAAMNELKEQVNRYDNLVQVLSGKISAVVKSSVPECEGLNQDKRRMDTQLGSDIDGVSTHMRGISNSLEELINRIEL